jgi:hypothetical protein
MLAIANKQIQGNSLPPPSTSPHVAVVAPSSLTTYVRLRRTPDTWATTSHPNRAIATEDQTWPAPFVMTVTPL